MRCHFLAIQLIAPVWVARNVISIRFGNTISLESPLDECHEDFVKVNESLGNGTRNKCSSWYHLTRIYSAYVVSRVSTMTVLIRKERVMRAAIRTGQEMVIRFGKRETNFAIAGKCLSAKAWSDRTRCELIVRYGMKPDWDPVSESYTCQLQCFLCPIPEVVYETIEVEYPSRTTICKPRW